MRIELTPWALSACSAIERLDLKPSATAYLTNLNLVDTTTLGKGGYDRLQPLLTTSMVSLRQVSNGVGFRFDSITADAVFVGWLHVLLTDDSSSTPQSYDYAFSISQSKLFYQFYRLARRMVL